MLFANGYPEFTGRKIDAFTINLITDCYLTLIVLISGNQCISSGHKVEVQFYGKQRRLQVTSVKGQLKDNMVSCVSTTTDLSNQLEALKLDSTSTNNVHVALPCDELSSCETLTSSCKENDCEKELSEDADTEQFTGLIDQTDRIQPSAKHQCQNHMESQPPPHGGCQSVFYYISPEDTQLTVHAHGTCQSKDNESRKKVTFNSIGGLRKQVALVREMIELPLKHPEMFTNYGK